MCVFQHAPQSSKMNARQLKAQQIVATGNITGGNGCYHVPSQSGNGRYKVVLAGLFPHCTCPDFELTNEPCKHMMAVRSWLDECKGKGRAERISPAVRLPRKTYKQDWPNYNLAQTTEKAWLMPLLADLCRSIPEPERKNQRGRPIPLADGLFAAVFKVYSGFSARRFACDLDEARERGHIGGRAPHFNSVLSVLDSEAVTPILTDLIGRSAAPLRAVETEFAVDSSGFSGCRFVRWFDEKYGEQRKEVSWVKAHICCGTRTNIIAAAEVLHKDTADSPRLPGLVKATAENFQIEELTADKAYASRKNFSAVDGVGGAFYPAFKENTTGAAGGLFGKAFHYFCLNREEYLTHYHRRSLVESTFSMVKRKFGDSVKAKTETAMRNEVLAKLVCHNVCCLVSAIYELGIDPDTFGLSGETDDGPREILRFPGCTIDRRPAQ
jgi:transposase